MEFTSFTTTVNDFFMIANNERAKFDVNIVQYVIPKYQREYKWTNEQVKTLISDINKHEKFLGNIILNKFENFYEIVDGQQRITTLYLILIALFNKNKFTSSPNRSEEQKQLFTYINHTDTQNHEHLTLKNESIGCEYLAISENNIEININTTEDCYYQKETFDNIFQTITQELASIEDSFSFQKKLLDSQLLILIGDTRGRYNDSIEEVFLDINFKSKLLDVADIFKGYCFRNYANTSHDELKTHWTKIRKHIKEFEKIGYKDDGKSCEYIYHYLLSKPDTYNIPSNLSYNGVHYLENKHHSETRNILVDMCEYGDNIFNFYEKLKDSTYFFEDICSDASRYKSDTKSHVILKKLLTTIISNPSAQYYKLPIFMLIHYIYKHKELKNNLTYEQFKKLVSNYYTYSFLFVSNTQSKSKSLIDKTILTALYKIDDGESSETVLDNVLTAIKSLRKESLDNYTQFKNFIEEKAYALYSLMDYYSAQNNFISSVYEYPNFNKEHLIAHDNKNLNVDWEDTNNNFTFSLKELLGKVGNKYNAPQYKKLIANYIIIPPELNEKLGIKDIVTKIKLIKEYYNQQNKDLPKHIKIFLENIENSKEYRNLVSLKGKNISPDEIKEADRKSVV